MTATQPRKRHGTPSQRKVPRWARRPGWILAGLLAGLLTLSLIGAVYQEVATRSDQRRFPPPGELIDVGGHRLQLHRTWQPGGDLGNWQPGHVG